MYDDDKGIDHEEYIHFNGPRRIEKGMNTLHGIVAGMTADARINNKELAALTLWLGSYSEFIDRHPFNEVVPRIQHIVSDFLVDEDERADILWLCDRYSRSSVYDEATCAMQQLHGFLGGILADGVINEIELRQLEKWTEEHEVLRGVWPYEEVQSFVAHVLKDGKVDDQEHEALIQLFGEFALTPGRQAVGALDRETTVSGICAYCPEIEFLEKYFCFTGSSKRSTRAGIVEVIKQLGGDHHPRIRNDTHYLIIGAAGNPCWAYSCYGRKVEDAVERRRTGQKLLLVHELDFWDAVADNGGDAHN